MWSGNVSFCLGFETNAAASGLALGGWRKGVPSMGKEWPRSPRPCLGPPVNLLLIAGYNTKAENVGHKVLNSVVALVWKKWEEV